MDKHTKLQEFFLQPTERDETKAVVKSPYASGPLNVQNQILSKSWNSGYVSFINNL